MNTEPLTIDSQKAGLRLDHFLVQQLPHISRSRLQKFIKEQKVTVNGNHPSVHQFLKEGDIVALAFEPSETNEREKVGNTRNWKIDIIAEKPDYLIVNKPAGILVHPAESAREYTLVDYILEHYPEIKGVGEDPLRPGIVHRLDRDVSGVMVIARTWNMYEHLRTLFRDRKVTKEYEALVHGSPSAAEGDISFSIGRSKQGDGKMSAKPDESGKAAHTRFIVLESFRNYALLRVMPQTGRMHQIRVHLRAYGLPIVGDALYHARQRKNDLGAARPLLSAVKLSFADLTGAVQTYSAPRPEDFDHILESLRNSNTVKKKI